MKKDNIQISYLDGEMWSRQLTLIKLLFYCNTTNIKLFS
jgi:hypothetical protein